MEISFFESDRIKHGATWSAIGSINHSGGIGTGDRGGIGGSHQARILSEGEAIGKSGAKGIKGRFSPFLFDFENHPEQPSEVPLWLAVLFEPAEILGWQRLEGAALKSSGGHPPGTKLSPIGDDFG
ncbi:MAG: hypothetical protein OHK005_07520 [Candidatus Methylacidiphilales bacterium]